MRRVRFRACGGGRRTRAPVSCWRMAWDRHDSSLFGGGRRRLGGTRGGHVALSVPVHGARIAIALIRPKLAHATVRAAVAEAGRLAPDLPLIAGGKSFGGRITSQAQAASPLPRVWGLTFLAFPLHPAGKPSSNEPSTCSRSTCRCSFFRGPGDALADVQHLTAVFEGLGRAPADSRRAHRGCGSFVPRAGPLRWTDADLRGEILELPSRPGSTWLSTRAVPRLTFRKVIE